MNCPECHQPAPSGVCMGPHPTYSLVAAINRGDVLPGEGTRMNINRAARLAEWRVRCEHEYIERLRIRTWLAVSGHAA